MVAVPADEVAVLLATMQFSVRHAIAARVPAAHATPWSWTRSASLCDWHGLDSHEMAGSLVRAIYKYLDKHSTTI
jgi:hypothetical protein